MKKKTQERERERERERKSYLIDPKENIKIERDSQSIFTWKRETLGEREEEKNVW